MIGRIALLVVFGALSTMALAADQRDLSTCPGGPKIAFANQISACTALIKDGRLQPKDLALAYLKRGNAYGAMGKLDLAVADFTEAIRLDAKFFEAHANRGLTYAKQRRFDRAIPDYNQALKLKADVKVVVNRGAAYDALGNYDAALRDMDYAISKRPDDHVLYSARGLTHLSKGDNELALADFDRAITLKPDDARTRGQRCWTQAVIGKTLERALSDCDESLRMRDGYERARASRAFVYFRLKRFDEAIADATAVLKTEPKFADALYVRGLAKGQKGDRKGSATDIAAARAVNPKIVDEYFGYGIAKP
jgi:tetratricopeptide (TPR) repeat protein